MLLSWVLRLKDYLCTSELRLDLRTRVVSSPRIGLLHPENAPVVVPVEHSLHHILAALLVLDNFL